MKNTTKLDLRQLHMILARCLYTLTVIAMPISSTAQEVDVEPVNWAYSSIFGTGWYSVEGNQSLFAIKLPVRQTLRRPSVSPSEGRKIGVEIDYALSVGLYKIDDLPGLLDPDNFGSLVFTPGVILDLPLTERWRLRPYANLGLGTKLGSSDWAWIYYTGIKSRYTFPTSTNNWALISSVYYGGYSPSVGQSNGLTGVQAGLEYRQQLKSPNSKGEFIDLHWTLAYSYLTDSLRFSLPDESADRIDDQIEVAVAYSVRNRPLKLWFIEFDNLGVGYRVNSDGTFKGVSLNLGSWFTR